MTRNLKSITFLPLHYTNLIKYSNDIQNSDAVAKGQQKLSEENKIHNFDKLFKNTNNCRNEPSKEIENPLELFTFLW